MIRFFFLCLAMIANPGYAKSADHNNEQQIINTINRAKNSTPISESMLPTPYNKLLTQPLMTKAIEDYYQRTAIIHMLYTRVDSKNNTYSRAILMLIDRNIVRNNPKLAKEIQESKVVELAFITMNFNVFSKKLISDVLGTNVPFGQLLSANHVKISVSERSYFSIKCDQILASLTECNLNKMLYGRINTINSADNQQWLAHVIEILP